MNTTLHPFRLSPGAPAPSLSRRLRRGAFSLVEVTLALGIVTFALVGVIGVLPTAMSSGRQGFDQNRAAAIANTLFTSFRSQSFNNVCYLDSQFQDDGITTVAGSGLDLNSLNTTSAPANDPQPFYVSFNDVALANTGTDSFGEQRHLSFTQTAPANGTRYLVTLHFNNQPPGMPIVPPTAAPTGMPASGGPQAEANQIEIVISPLAQPTTKYDFISTIANRL